MIAFAEVRPEARDTLAAPTGRGALLNRVLSSRVRILTEIAERYAELTDPQSGPSGVRGDGGSVGLTPHEPRCLMLERAPDGKNDPTNVRRPHCTCAYRTVAEFERLVLRLRESDRSLWWHLDGWWLSAETRTVFHCPRCGVTHKSEHQHPSRRNGGKLVSVKCKRVLVWSRRPGARESSAKAGLEWVALAWGLSSEPMLPDEIRAVA